MTTLSYDFHRFTTDELDARGFSQTQGVSRVVAFGRPLPGCTMTARFRWATAGLVVAGAACGDIATPIRNDFYEWRLIVPAASGSGNDSLTFHWPKDRLPVRIWVEDAASLPVNVPAAIAAWRRAFLYDEFDATIVADSATADVIVRAGSAPGVQFSRTAAAQRARAGVRRRHRPGHQRRPHASSGSRFGSSSSRDPSPTRPTCPPAWRSPPPTSWATRSASGEHSPTATDLMFADPVVDAPSDRDLATAELIYHVPPNVEAVGP